ncbi:MAG: AAA family ATPase [Marinoscillum sp.]
MNSNHFNYFRVKNFKRFKDLEVKDIGQFNLVLGDNNVGKTSLLEALMWERVEESSGDWLSEKTVIAPFLSYLIKSFCFKNFGDPSSFLDYFISLDDQADRSMEFFDQFSGHAEVYTAKKRGVISVSSKEFIPDSGSFGNEWDFQIVSELNTKNQESTSATRVVIEEEVQSTIVPLLPFQRSYDEEITEFYLENIQGNKSLKNSYVKSLRVLFPEIEDVEPSLIGHHKSLLINRTTSNHSLPLGYFGEGTIKMAKILSYLIKFNSKKLMIDEIDTGIHYSRMKDYWKVILQSARENDVQLFATTHNRECMEGFQAALEELGADYTSEARAITLKQSPKTGDIVAFTNSFEVLDDALEIGNDLR